VGNYHGKGQVEDSEEEEEMRLKWTSEREFDRMGGWSNWLRIGSSEGLWCLRCWSLRF